MKHRHSISRDPQAQQSSHDDGPGTTWRLLIPTGSWQRHICRALSSGRAGVMWLLTLPA